MTQPEPEPAAHALQRLATLSFGDLLTMVDPIGTNKGDRQVIDLYRNWIALQGSGGHQAHAAWFNLGAEWGHAGDIENAILAYRTALALRPDFAPAAINLGLLLERRGDPKQALDCWRVALQADESRIMLINQRARLLEQLVRLDEAEAEMRSSLEIQPDQPDVIQHWLHIRQRMCQWPILTDTIRGLSRADLMANCGPLAALALTDQVAVQAQVAADWIERKIPPAPEHLAPAGGYHHERIRVGYMSSDFCSHAMSYLIAELFERHDRSRFEIHGYCTSPEDGSAIRKRVIAAFDHFTIIKTMSDEAAARAIRADEIDILIDLNGLTAHSRLAVLRWRPAPIQATYLGFIGPVPLPELDYLLCDDFVIPPQQAASYRPEPLRIARIYQANDSKRAIAPSLSRSAAGLPEDRFVFCCFSNHYKITEDMFAAWMAIMRNVDRAVLWLAADNAWSQANLHAAALRAGVAPERIIFAERTSPELYMSRLALADLFLDTFPYNAGTIASDAIRMRLPLLTLCGGAFASRMAGCLLHAIGARLGIATSMAEYVATATTLATNARVYADYKNCFTTEAWNGTLGNIAQFTAEFETTLARVTADACVAA